MSRHRVSLVGASGYVGGELIRWILGHPELELVGVWVHGEDKAGRDAGELCGLDRRVGVTATTDVDEILAHPSRPAAVWMQLGIQHGEAAARLRSAGIQVVQDRCIMVEHRRLANGSSVRLS